MATRVVLGGLPGIPGATMLDRREYFTRNLDHIRTLLMCEPRGHAAMSGAILLPPIDPEADWGVLFIEVSGMLAMCGHGTIGVATVLAETGMIPLQDGHAVTCLETPAGLVRAEVTVSSDVPTRVRIRNVPAFVDMLDAEVKLPDGSLIGYDMSFGGNFYAIVGADSLGLDVDVTARQSLLDAGLELMEAINEQRRPSHPLEPRIAGCKHVIFTAPGRMGSDMKTATVIHPGWIDRSPCGTGTSALMARLHARGELEIGEQFTNESLIGTRFDGVLSAVSTLAGRPAVLPEITGRAWITGIGQYLLDPTDPFPAGFEI